MCSLIEHTERWQREEVARQETEHNNTEDPKGSFLLPNKGDK